MPATLGPNTNAPATLLSSNCILIAGEDRTHLLPLLQSQDNPSHAFRGYEFWQQPAHTIILCGIGTGCLEPLLWEILQPRIIRQIILLGTAGKMPGASVTIGQPYAISEASLAGTGLDHEHLPAPLRPRWNLSPDTPTATSASTDFFYGFSPHLLRNEYPLATGRLRCHFESHLKRCTSLVEMEVAQFYAFCQLFGDPALNFLAIKGPSNELGNDTQQVAESPGILKHCMKLANELMTT